MPSQDNNSNQNLHAAAADLYGTNIQKNTPNQRELEAHVLLKSAKFLKDIQKDWDNLTPEILEETLKYNRQIWMMFYDTALENTEGDRPNDLRSNIINLANFVFKRELDIMGAPDKKKLDVLININREIAAGLMANSEQPSTKDQAQKNDDDPIPEKASETIITSA
jgi:flagellar protein FlaF